MNVKIHFLLIMLSVFTLTACSGGGGTPSPITSFVASPETIVSGQSVNLTATFTSGTGVIDNGVGGVTSGVAVSVTPASTTIYTLTVTDTDGKTYTATVTVTVLSFSTVNISWSANPETAVNRPDGGYKVYYSSTSGFNLSDGGVTEIDVPYNLGPTAPTSTQIQLLPGTYYIRIIAYSALNAPPGTTGGSSSIATSEITLVVP